MVSINPVTRSGPIRIEFWSHCTVTSPFTRPLRVFCKVYREVKSQSRVYARNRYQAVNGYSTLRAYEMFTVFKIWFLCPLKLFHAFGVRKFPGFPLGRRKKFRQLVSKVDGNLRNNPAELKQQKNITMFAKVRHSTLSQARSIQSVFLYILSKKESMFLPIYT